MAHIKQMKLTRIAADLLEEVRSLQLEQKSDIKRVEYLVRLGIKQLKHKRLE